MYFIWSKQNIFSIIYTLTFLVIIFYWNNIVYDNYYYCRIVSFILLCTKILFLIIIQTSLRSIFVLIKSFFFYDRTYYTSCTYYLHRCHRCIIFQGPLLCAYVYFINGHREGGYSRYLASRNFTSSPPTVFNIIFIIVVKCYWMTMYIVIRTRTTLH